MDTMIPHDQLLRLICHAEVQINSLADFPAKFKLVDDPVLASWGINFVIVSGYLAFYVIQKKHTELLLYVFCFRKATGQPSWDMVSHCCNNHRPVCHKMAGYISQVIGNCFLQGEIPHKFTYYPKYRKIMRQNVGYKYDKKQG